MMAVCAQRPTTTGEQAVAATRRWGAVVALVAASGLPAAAAEPPLMCFGNEPSWSLALDRPGAARLTLGDGTETAYRGSDTRLEPLRERVWRGNRDGGADLVAFLREADCSDGMSDVMHPVVVRVSVDSGRVLAGCCRVVAAAAAPAAASAIEGPVWRLTRLRGLDEKALAAVADGATVRFEQGQLQGFGGCNRMAGSYTIDGGRLTIGPLAGTMMACPAPAMAVESAFTKALAGTLHFRVDDGSLTLAPEPNGEPALVFAATAPPRLEGVAWEVTGYNNGRQAVVSPLTGTVLTVTFENGAIVGNAGCNSFRAAYTRDGDRLTVGPAAATRKQCKSDVMKQEQEFLAAIESATTWGVDHGMLDLHRGDGERVLHARPAGKP